MRILYILTLFTLISCAQYTKGKKEAIPFSQEVLNNRVLKELKLDKPEIEIGDIVSKASPHNSKETIIIIPEVIYIDEEQDVYELNSNIVIVNNTTGKITHKFFESSKTNGWVSNAIFIDEIDIDTLTYKLNESKTAFGVTIKFRSGSQPNPYSSESISLFTKEKKGLKKVLDSYTIYESSGEVNVNLNACYAIFNTINNKLTMGNSMTNGYYDILVKNTISQRSFSKNENNECNPTKKIISTEKKILKYDGKLY